VPLEALCAALDFEIESGEALLVAYSLGVLVQLLASQGGSDGVAQAQDFVTRFEANVPAVPGPAIQLWLLRCRALLANAVGDTVIGSELLTKYRDLAEALDAPGHLAFAKQFAAAMRFEA
jgi:adenylate cyclase